MHIFSPEGQLNIRLLAINRYRKKPKPEKSEQTQEQEKTENKKMKMRAKGCNLLPIRLSLTKQTGKKGERRKANEENKKGE